MKSNVMNYLSEVIVKEHTTNVYLSLREPARYVLFNSPHTFHCAQASVATAERWFANTGTCVENVSDVRKIELLRII